MSTEEITGYVKCSFITGERAWGYKAIWTGWRRVIGFGVVLNIVAPAATVWICGWQIMMGKLLVERSDLQKIAT